jgi:putative ABC transport system ATP-binding protein
MPIVELRGAVKDYPLGKTTVNALRGVDLAIERGEFTAIAGPSGSGKTTLLNLIGCVDTATKGEVLVDGEDVAKLSERARTSLRLHKLGFIFQTFNLIPVLDVFDNVEFPLLLMKGLTKKERRSRVEELIGRVGLSGQIKQRPGELSGGQRQRVAIARALVTRPQIVMADEPTANLDSVTGGNILDLMRELNETQQVTFIFSTHDEAVMAHARRLVKLIDGHVTSDQRLEGNGDGDVAAAG